MGGSSLINRAVHLLNAHLAKYSIPTRFDFDLSRGREEALLGDLEKLLQGQATEMGSCNNSAMMYFSAVIGQQAYLTLNVDKRKSVAKFELTGSYWVMEGRGLTKRIHEIVNKHSTTIDYMMMGGGRY